MSAAEFVALRAREGRNPSKYRNVQTVVDGIAFDSKAEARYYQDELRIRELAGDITDLQLQPRFDLAVNGETITRYTADFSFRDRTGCMHVVDVKSAPTRTRDYVIRRKLMKVLLGIEVEEVLQ